MSYVNYMASRGVNWLSSIQASDNIDSESSAADSERLGCYVMQGNTNSTTAHLQPAGINVQWKQMEQAFSARSLHFLQKKEIQNTVCGFYPVLPGRDN